MPVQSSLIRRLIEIVRKVCKPLNRDFHEIRKLNNYFGAKKFFEACHKRISKELFQELAFYKRIIGTEYEFTLFPLDGEENFIRGVPFFCVAILLKRNSAPYACVIEAPLFYETFWAEKTYFAYLEDANSTSRLKVSNAGNLENSMVLFNTAGLLKEKLAPNHHRCLGSIILSAAMLASARADILVLTEPEHINSNMLELCELLITESNGEKILYSAQNKDQNNIMANKKDNKIIFTNPFLKNIFLKSPNI